MSREKCKVLAGLTVAVALCFMPSDVLAKDSPVTHSETSWESAGEMGNVPYQMVDELRSFYKLDNAAKVRRKGAYCICNADVSLEFGPASNDLIISGVRIYPLHPLVRDAQGRFMVSRDDWVQWIDPIMRPTYLIGREEVKTVIIDAGHGGHDQGAQGMEENESRITLQVAEELQKKLEKIGMHTMLTRSGDYFLSEHQRVDAANMYPNAIFLTLHVNSGAAEKRGPEVYILSPLPPPEGEARVAAIHAPRSAALAYAVQCALSSVAGVAGGGCGHVHFSLLSSLKMPAVWIELGYATNQQESALLVTPAYREKLADAIAQAVNVYACYASPQGKLKVNVPPPPVAKPVKKATTSPSPRGMRTRKGHS